MRGRMRCPPQDCGGGVGAFPSAGAHAVRQTRWVGKAEQRGMQSAKMCMPEKRTPPTSSTCQPHSVRYITHPDRAQPLSSVCSHQGRHPLFVARVSKTHARHLWALWKLGLRSPCQSPKSQSTGYPNSPSLSLYLCIDFAHAQKLESSFLFAQVFRALWTTIKEINRHAGKGRMGSDRGSIYRALGIGKG